MRLILDTYLPPPSSVNRYHRSVVINGKLYVKLSKDGREYKATVAAKVHDVMPPREWMEPTEDRLHVDIEYRAPDARARDLDNLQKALLDAMEKAGVYRNDSQIDSLLIERCGIRSDGNAGVRVQVLSIGPPKVKGKKRK